MVSAPLSPRRQAALRRRFRRPEPGPCAHTSRRLTALTALAALLACSDTDTETAAPGRSGGDATTAIAMGAPPFTDLSAEVGLDFVHLNGMSGRYYFVEIMGAGSALLDYDGDGDLDIYLVQGHPLPPADDEAPTDRLYRNDLQLRPDGSRTLSFTDVTAESGIRASGYGMGAATGDYDNDGHIDLYVLNWGPNQLWRNNGDGTFSDVTAETGTGDPGWSTGAAFSDFDRDGWLDLIVVNYTRYTLAADRPCYAQSGRRDYCGPEAYMEQQDRLFRNLADGTFEDATLRMGLAVTQGPGLGVITADLDRDGWPDIYVANDRHENHLWLNRQGQRFEEGALMAGAAVNATGAPEASMGVVAQDFDRDGDDDLFMTHLAGETNTLYVNEGSGLFEDDSRNSGLGVASRIYTGFGVAPLDYDNDGWLDLYVANGAVTTIPEQVQRGDPLPLRQRDQLFRNLGDGRFRDVTPADDPAFEPAAVGRGVFYGDIDNDGDTDLLVANNNGPARLLRNDADRQRHWLGLRVLHADQGRDALGARIAVVRRGGTILWRRVHTDGSYASAHDPRVLFGLGDDHAIESAQIHWPDGTAEIWERTHPNRYHTVVRGQGDSGRVP